MLQHRDEEKVLEVQVDLKFDLDQATVPIVLICSNTLVHDLPITLIKHALIHQDQLLLYTEQQALWIIHDQPHAIVEHINQTLIRLHGRPLPHTYTSLHRIQDMHQLIEKAKQPNKSSFFKKKIKQLISKKKTRFSDEQYDLDLAYITDNIIAMGFPAENLEGVYRNHYDDVYRFFELKHFERYKVYNLCSEKQYSVSKFNGRCANYPFDDHSPPDLKMLIEFCEDTAGFLQQDKENVVAVHCKGGKGRTGTMIACLLLRLEICRSADEAISLFAQRRTKDGRGITNPGQSRYVQYYSQILKQQEIRPVQFQLIERKPLLLIGIKIYGIRGKLEEGFLPSFTVGLPNGLSTFDLKERNKLDYPVREVHCFKFFFPISGDVCVCFTNESKSPCTEYEFARIYFHTGLEIVSEHILHFGREALDGPHKSKRFSDEFSIELLVQEGGKDDFDRVMFTFQ
jgi:phosphatidylinositol-3,4,5-trisphosphate 3-phosphatase/dual-specificity protein phosphatase PTEN